MGRTSLYDSDDNFDYPQEYTKKVIDKNGYYKLNDHLKVYNRFPRSKIGEMPTDPPIYNKDGLIVSRDGASCYSKEEVMELDNGSKVYITRVYPNVPHEPYMNAVAFNLFMTLLDKFEKEEKEKQRIEIEEQEYNK